MPSPLVSVVMPARNAETTVDEALNSILTQTLTAFELIAVDDRSTDRTLEKLRLAASRDSRVRVVEGAGGGVTAALNQGIRGAAGTYIARQDADDRSMPTRLERQVDRLERVSGLCAVGTAATTIDDDGAAIGRFPMAHGVDAVRRGLQTALITPCHGSMMIRRDAMADAGGYREAFAASQDFDLWLRLLERGDIDNLDEPLYQWRLSSASVYGARRETQLMYGGIALAFAYERARCGRDSYAALESAGGDLEAFADGYRFHGRLRSIWGRLLVRALDNPGVARRHLHLAVRHGDVRAGTLVLWAWTVLGLPWIGSKPLRPRERELRSGIER